MTSQVQIVLSMVLVVSMAMTPSVVFSQSKTPTSKSLSDKENPLMIGKRNINRGQLNFYSIEKEIALGRQLAATIDQQLKLVDDPIITEYVNRIGQNIVLHSDAQMPFTIKVVVSDEINAFALPGGFFYVNTGLILAAENEAELAGVMAHEISHVVARHALENFTKSQLLSWAATVPLIFVGGGVGMLGQIGASFGLPLAFFKFSRNAENEADLLGAQYCWAAGYDPNGLLTMFEKLEAKRKKQPNAFSKLFMTHPFEGDRIKAVKDLIARFPERDEYIISSWEFNRIRDRLARLQGQARKLDAEGRPGEAGPPTLKRRRPSDAEQQSDDKSQEPREKPELKKRNP